MALRNSERRSDEAHDSDQISDEEEIVPFEIEQKYFLHTEVMPNDPSTYILSAVYTLDSSVLGLPLDLHIGVYTNIDGVCLLPIYDMKVSSGNLQNNILFNMSTFASGHYWILFRVGDEQIAIKYIKQ
jgi:hypothetical protein